jgi:hypothetical protein
MTNAMQPDEIEREGLALVRDAAVLVINDPESFTAAAEQLRLIKTYLRRVHDLMDPVVDAAYKAHKVAVSQRATLLVHAESAERTIKGRLSAYEQEEARKRREAEEAARRERERLEAEERARMVAEQARLRREEEDRRLAEAAAAEAVGDVARAEQIIAAPVVIPPVAPRPVFVAPPPAPIPRVEGVSFRDEWDFEISEESLIPRQYLTPDSTKIRGVVRALKDATAIPGIKVIRRRISAVRA